MNAQRKLDKQIIADAKKALNENDNEKGGYYCFCVLIRGLPKNKALLKF